MFYLIFLKAVVLEDANHEKDRIEETLFLYSDDDDICYN